jgi:hypothetical protein
MYVTQNVTLALMSIASQSCRITRCFMRFENTVGGLGSGSVSQEQCKKLMGKMALMQRNFWPSRLGTKTTGLSGGFFFKRYYVPDNYGRD